MIEFARRAVPALLAIFYLGSSMTPCPSVEPSAAKVAGDLPAVEASREVRSYAHHHASVAEVDTLSAPCPCGCGSDPGDSTLAKRLGTAVIFETDSERRPAEAMRPLVFAASVPDGLWRVPDPIPIPS